MIDAQEVERLAQAVRLQFTEEERAQVVAQLNAFQQYAAKLATVDTEQIVPTTHGLTGRNVMREDEVKPSLPLEKVFLNAPEHEDGQFVVPAVLE